MSLVLHPWLLLFFCVRKQQGSDSLLDFCSARALLTTFVTGNGTRHVLMRIQVEHANYDSLQQLKGRRRRCFKIRRQRWSRCHKYCSHWRSYTDFSHKTKIEALASTNRVTTMATMNFLEYLRSRRTPPKATTTSIDSPVHHHQPWLKKSMPSPERMSSRSLVFATHDVDGEDKVAKKVVRQSNESDGRIKVVTTFYHANGCMTEFARYISKE